MRLDVSKMRIASWWGCGLRVSRMLDRSHVGSSTATSGPLDALSLLADLSRK